jgi:membrane-associated protease RseP (regulator of RpoE activity)
LESIGCLLGFLLVALSSANTEDALAKPVTVPFELLPTKHMAVQLRINGKGPYRVIFDTGAPITLLSSRAAKESGVVPAGTPAPLFGMLGATGQVPIKKLQLGALVAEDIPTVVLDHPAIEIMSKAFGRLDGILGFPFFARYRMTLDYQHQELTFAPSTYRPPDALKAMMTTMMTFADDRLAKNVLAPAALWGFTVQKKRSDEGTGVEVASVSPGGPAAVAGLRAGDRVLSLDGRWTDSAADLYRATSYVKPESTAHVVISRHGKELTLNVRPRSGL